jgi:hypothetical protein
MTPRLQLAACAVHSCKYPSAGLIYLVIRGAPTESALVQRAHINPMVCRVGLASPFTAGYKHLLFSPPPPPPPSLADSASRSCSRHHPTWSRFCLFVSALSINLSMPRCTREPSPSPPPHPAILSRQPRHLNTTQVVLRPASLPPRTQQAPRLARLSGNSSSSSDAPFKHLYKHLDAWLGEALVECEEGVKPQTSSSWWTGTR